MRSLLYVSCLVALPAVAGVPGRTKVAVLPTQSSAELRAVADSIAEQVLTELARDGRIEPVGASDVAALLGLERQQQLMGCSEASTSCMAEISAALGAPYLVTGSVAQLGTTVRLDLKLIRTQDGKAIFRDGQSFKDQGQVFDGVSGIVRVMIGALELGGSPGAPAAGVSQAAAPGRPGPWILLGVGAAAVVGGAVLVGVGAGQRDATKAALAATSGTPPTYDVAKQQLSGANTLMLTGALVSGAGMAAAIVGVVWALAGRPAPQVSAFVTPNAIGLGGSF